MDDLSILELLFSLGFKGEGAERVLERLHREGLVRPGGPGKTRIVTAKSESVERMLSAAFMRHCRKSACLPAPGEGRKPVLVVSAHRETCGEFERLCAGGIESIWVS